MFQTFSPAASTPPRSSAAPMPPLVRSRFDAGPSALRQPRIGRNIDGATWRALLGHWIDSAWPSLLGAMRQAGSSKAVRDAAPLARVRADFSASLIDIDTPAALKVQRRIALAPSLHELWHVRAELFDLVSRQHDQSEAERRLTRLNCHFQSRARRAPVLAHGRLPLGV